MEKDEKSISTKDSAQPWQSYNTIYTTAKAGMEGVDKEKVQKIVYEMSKGSKYFENEERKEAYMKQRVESMRAQLSKLTDSDISHHQKIADKRIVELETTRDLSRIWLHVDMDAFYAAVETLCNPSLEGKAMAVGGMSMISTANYEARKFGVRAAMPGFIARKLCPELIFVPVDFKKYTHFSDLTRKVFQKFDPNFLAGSLDEAYLDITDFCNDNGMTGGQVAEALREGVYNETGLTCSAGVGPNRLLAKVCSDINKPNGQFVLPNERVACMTFISSLPIRKIGGIGKVTENILKGVFEITTCEEMLEKSSYICAFFSRTSADFFLSVGLGLGGTDKPLATQRKSMSTERTFSATEDEVLIHQKLVDLSENLCSDMKKEGLRGRTLTLKLKTSSFEVRTRAVTLAHYIWSSEDILKHATKLLKAELPVSLRLMGLRMSYFNEDGKGGAIDPKQKTLSNFVVTLAKGLGDEALLESNTCGNTIEEIHEPSESIDFVDTYEMPESDLIDTNNHNVGDHDTQRGTMNPFPSGLMENDSSSGLLEECKREEIRGNEDEAGSSSKQVMFWLNDYQCSVCGIELPPSFIPERQEHFDFHLAQRMQQQDEKFNTILKPKQKLGKGQTSHNKQRKKQKASPSQGKGKHIPIDIFFEKTTQHF